MRRGPAPADFFGPGRAGAEARRQTAGAIPDAETAGPAGGYSGAAAQARRRVSEPILLCWSGGKDSARSLRELRANSSLEVAGLLCSLSREHERISMHGVRRELLEAQTRAVGLPLATVELPTPCGNAEYERAMERALEPFLADGVRRVAFGDLYLEDVRRYREERLARVGMTGLFPLWGRDTRELAEEFIELGFVAHLTCVDPRQIDRGLCGRRYDARLLADLPRGADPCGENGEFHTFVSAGPIFSAPVGMRTGEIVERDGFVWCDLLAT
jgi:uncharacterized protein (TIGR00290 family)